MHTGLAPGKRLLECQNLLSTILKENVQPMHGAGRTQYCRPAWTCNRANSRNMLRHDVKHDVAVRRSFPLLVSLMHVQVGLRQMDETFLSGAGGGQGASHRAEEGRPGPYPGLCRDHRAGHSGQSPAEARPGREGHSGALRNRALFKARGLPAR